MTFRDALTFGRTLVMDGAMGSELIRRGFTSATWRANLDAPELVRAIHADFADAGAEVLLTNTFVMNPRALRDESLMEVGQAAVRLARSVAGPRWLLGSMGPEAITGANFADPGAVLSTVAALHGVDGILLETCSDLSAFAAAEWIRGRYPELPVLVSFTFAPNEDAKASAWARAAQASDIAALGVNCGREQAPADVGRILDLFRRETTKPLFARPNAGTPKREGNAWIYPLSPEEWANETAKLCEFGSYRSRAETKESDARCDGDLGRTGTWSPSLGASGSHDSIATANGIAMIGGCCGSTPEHIEALSVRLRRG